MPVVGSTNDSSVRRNLGSRAPDGSPPPGPTGSDDRSAASERYRLRSIASAISAPAPRTTIHSPEPIDAPPIEINPRPPRIISEATTATATRVDADSIGLLGGGLG